MWRTCGSPCASWDPRSWAGENISGIPADLVAGLRMLPLHHCCGLARFWAIKKADPKISLETSTRIRSCLKINTYAARDATSHFIDSFSQWAPHPRQSAVHSAMDLRSLPPPGS